MRRLLALLVVLPACGDRGVAFPSDGGVWPARPALAFASQPRLVVPDINDDTLAFVSLDLPQPKLYGLELIGDNPVEAEGPHDVAASPDGAALYVDLSNFVPGSGSGPHGAHGLGTVPGSLVKYDARTLGKLGETTVDKNASEIILTSDGKTVYVSHYDLAGLQKQVTMGLPAADGLSTIAVVNAETMARPDLYPVCPTAHDLELSGDEKTLYVTCSMSDELALFDVATHAVKRVPVGPAPGAILSPNYFPYSALRCPADGSVWIGCQTSAELRVYDPKTGAMDEKRTIRLSGVPVFGDFLPDGKTLVMPHQGDDKISIIDTALGKEIASIAVPPAACLNIRNTQLGDDGKTAWFTCEGDHATRPGSVIAVDLESQSVLGYVEVGLFANAIDLLPPAP